MPGVKFRGLDPRTGLARWGLTATALGILLGGTIPAAARELGVLLVTNHDSAPWYLMRVLGFLAYLALSGSVTYGLLMSTRLIDAIAHRPITFALHQDLASVGLALAGVHGILLLLDRFVPFTFAQVAIPGLSPYRGLWVAAGQVGSYLTLLVVASFYLRRHLGQRTWRALHYVTFLAFLTAAVHGIRSGTDSAQPWAAGLYAFTLVLVGSLLAYRVWLAMSAQRGSGSRSIVGIPARETRPSSTRPPDFA